MLCTAAHCSCLLHGGAHFTLFSAHGCSAASHLRLPSPNPVLPPPPPAFSLRSPAQFSPAPGDSSSLLSTCDPSQPLPLGMCYLTLQGTFMYS